MKPLGRRPGAVVRPAPAFAALASVRRARPGDDGARQRSGAVAGRQDDRVPGSRDRLRREQGHERHLDRARGRRQAAAHDRRGIQRDRARAGRTTARLCISSRRRTAPASSGASMRRAALRRQATSLALDVNNFKLSPDGKHVLLSIDVFPSAPARRTSWRARRRSSTRARPTRPAARSTTSSSCATGTPGPTAAARSCSSPISAPTARSGEPHLLSQGIDGDVPSKPFGDDSEYAFSPDGKTVYFDARIAGKTEPWSTNFDIFSVPADGSCRAEEPDRRQPRRGMPIRCRRPTARRCTTSR